VIENTCSLTNTNWTIDGNEVELVHHLRTKVVNDFYALSFGVPLLDTNDPAQIAVLKHPDGSCPPETGFTRQYLGQGQGSAWGSSA
jgi:glucokinase